MAAPVEHVKAPQDNHVGVVSSIGSVRNRSCRVRFAVVFAVVVQAIDSFQANRAAGVRHAPELCHKAPDFGAVLRAWPVEAACSAATTAVASPPSFASVAVDAGMAPPRLTATLLFKLARHTPCPSTSRAALHSSSAASKLLATSTHGALPASSNSAAWFTAVRAAPALAQCTAAAAAPTPTPAPAPACSGDAAKAAAWPTTA
eukprot:CAMPEP_0171970218 /NCGR_PEP_ID=MMETSP0993-20121228/212006_1 /TAXON_ID=483369 /ORGANISM="non described non described, Strain CCMP2098" /LENGTH=202 /DNA_ID=CAMNT_0012620295 /DNA_START=386 /DNA_END=992 /DNA_ORIENTATION=-